VIARTLALLVGLIVATSAGAQTPPAPLVLEAKIPLGSISGRIDHLAIDLKRKWLFVAELGNDSLGVVNLIAGKVLRTITGLSKPQGVGYEPITDAVYVANASDGSVRILRGEDLAAVGRIDLSDDADNVRIDADRNRVLVGYGAGALAIIDPTTRTKVGEPLPAPVSTAMIQVPVTSAAAATCATANRVIANNAAKPVLKFVMPSPCFDQPRITSASFERHYDTSAQ